MTSFQIWVLLFIIAYILMALTLSYKPKTTGLSDQIIPLPPGESIEFQDLELGPNDILVAHCDKYLNTEQRESLTKKIKDGLQDGFILIDGSMVSFQVIRRTKC